MITEAKSIGDVVREASQKGADASKAYADSKTAVAAPPATEPKEMRASFKAVNVDDQGVIIGVGASIAIDKENEAVQKGALIGIAYDFCASKARTFLANHDKEIALDAELVCSWPGAPVLKSGKILEPGVEIPADDPIVGINIEKGKETHWFVGVRPKDQRIVDAARKGEIAGFSWGGLALKSEE